MNLNVYGSVSISSNDNRKVSREDIELVWKFQGQNLIERCLQLYMNRDEVVKTLLNRARIDPGFTISASISSDKVSHASKDACGSHPQWDPSHASLTIRESNDVDVFSSAEVNIDGTKYVLAKVQVARVSDSDALGVPLEELLADLEINNQVPKDDSNRE
ncbi:angiotensin-converting enzyme 2 [Tanacetum coccineum]